MGLFIGRKPKNFCGYNGKELSEIQLRLFYLTDDVELTEQEENDIIVGVEAISAVINQMNSRKFSWKSFTIDRRGLFQEDGEGK